MTAERSSTMELPIERPALLQLLRFVAPLVPLAVFIQAIFAGQGLFEDTDLLDIHGGLGTLTLLLAVIQAALILLAGFRGRARVALIGMSLALVVLIVVQLGLGYSGRDGGQAAAIHVPNGLVVFGLAVGTATMLSRYRREAEGSGAART
ncbi:MAG: DUF6220 domain-containing protein [Dehalococcoidia bacterium]